MKRNDNKKVTLTFTDLNIPPVEEIWTHITDIDSTNVKDMLFNKQKNGVLIVEFHHGGKYHYSDIKSVEFETILNSPSIGKALREWSADSKAPYYKISE